MAGIYALPMRVSALFLLLKYNKLGPLPCFVAKILISRELLF